MCEAYPGPRCSPEMKNKLITRENKLQKMLTLFGENSPEYNKTLQQVKITQEHYDATPEGLNILSKMVTDNPENINILERYIKAKHTREMQQNAVKERRNGRVELLTEIYSHTETFFDKEEIFSIIDASREYQEENILNNPTATVKQSTVEDYQQYVKSLSKHPTLINNKEAHKLIKKLETISPPDNVNLNSYMTLHSVLKQSEQQLKNEIKRIAILNSINEKTSAEIYDSYREQYKMVYSNLPEIEQPNPPEKWVKGELTYGSYTKNPSTRFIPRDPASLYATYRLTADPNAVPDYMKKRENFTEIMTENNTIKISIFSPNGKKLFTREYTQFDKTNPSEAVTERNRVIQADIIKHLENNILLTTKNINTNEMLKNIIPREHIKTIKMLNITEYVLKHSNLPDLSIKSLSQELGNINIKHSHSQIFFKTLKNVYKTWGNKPARKHTPQVSFTQSTRWKNK